MCHEKGFVGILLAQHWPEPPAVLEQNALLLIVAQRFTSVGRGERLKDRVVFENLLLDVFVVDCVGERIVDARVFDSRRSDVVGRCDDEIDLLDAQLTGQEEAKVSAELVTKLVQRVISEIVRLLADFSANLRRDASQIVELRSERLFDEKNHFGRESIVRWQPIGPIDSHVDRTITKGR